MLDLDARSWRHARLPVSRIAADSRTTRRRSAPSSGQDGAVVHGGGREDGGARAARHHGPLDPCLWRHAPERQPRDQRGPNRFGIAARGAEASAILGASVMGTSGSAATATDRAGAGLAHGGHSPRNWSTIAKIDSTPASPPRFREGTQQDCRLAERERRDRCTPHPPPQPLPASGREHTIRGTDTTTATSMRLSCPGRVQRAHLRERNRSGTTRVRSAMAALWRQRIVAPADPGSRACAHRQGHGLRPVSKFASPECHRGRIAADRAPCAAPRHPARAAGTAATALTSVSSAGAHPASPTCVKPTRARSSTTR